MLSIVSVGAFVSKQRAPHSAQRSRRRKRLGSWRAEGMRARSVHMASWQCMFDGERSSAQVEGRRTSVGKLVRRLKTWNWRCYSTSARDAGRPRAGNHVRDEIRQSRRIREDLDQTRRQRESTSRQSIQAEWWRLCSEGVASGQRSVVKQEAAVAIPNEAANRFEMRERGRQCEMRIRRVKDILLIFQDFRCRTNDTCLLLRDSSIF